MYELFILALLYTVFAVVQDLKTREVANWLNFSLIAFALSFRIFYALITDNFHFLYYGLIGLAVFVTLAYILYYSKAFAGGDAKLLMGFGIIMPYNSYTSIFALAVVFIFLLFLSGAVYSIIYSIFIAFKNKSKFKLEFSRNLKANTKLLAISPILFILILILLSKSNYLNTLTVVAIVLLFIVVPWIWVYTKSLERCMVKLYSYSKLTEGDWLEKDVRLSNGKMVRKTVHGLSLKDIQLLKKYKKSVLIKEGIPFTPAFLIALIIMVFSAEALLDYLQTLVFALY